MQHPIRRHIQRTIDEIKSRGLYKEERIILSSQEVSCKIGKGQKGIEFLY